MPYHFLELFSADRMLLCCNFYLIKGTDKFHLNSVTDKFHLNSVLSFENCPVKTLKLILGFLMQRNLHPTAIIYVNMLLEE
jgi:hypothetical protein